MSNKKIILIVSIAFVIAVVLGWFVTKYFFISTEKKQTPQVTEGSKSEQIPDTTLESDSEDSYIMAKIFLPSKDGLLIEDKKLKSKVLAVEMTEALLKEYLNRLKEQMGEVKVLGVYRDRGNTIYIDFSDEFRRNFSGDVKQEYYLLKSLFETVTKNIPETEDVRLLIEGREIESIGGHFFSLYGLKSIIQ